MVLKEGEPRKHWGRCPETSTKVGTVCLLVTWPEKNQPPWHWPESKEITRSRSIDMEETGGPRSWGTHLVLDVAHKRPLQAQGPTCTCSYTRTFNIYILQTDTYIHISTLICSYTGTYSYPHTKSHAWFLTKTRTPSSPETLSPHNITFAIAGWSRREPWLVEKSGITRAIRQPEQQQLHSYLEGTVGPDSWHSS